MAVTPTNIDAWIPEEKDGPVIQQIKKSSVVEDVGLPETMSSTTKKIPRDGGVSFEGATPKSTAIAKDLSENDTILLTARKLARIIEFSEEDLADTSQVADAIATKQIAWATAYGKGFDNATLAVTAAENGTTIPFTSVYRELTTSHTDIPDADYNANDNVVVAASGGVTYRDFSDLFGLVEESDWWEDGNMLVIAHPGFRKEFRGIMDSQNRPVFLENQQLGTGTGDTLWGLQIRWSLGAKTSAVSTDKPTGRRLLFVVNKNMLRVGKRSGPEYMFADADSGPAFEVDDALLKFRTRRGFKLAHPRAAAMLVGR